MPTPLPLKKVILFLAVDSISDQHFLDLESLYYKAGLLKFIVIALSVMFSFKLYGSYVYLNGSYGLV